MACEVETPTDVLAFLLECAQEHLETRPFWTAEQNPLILVGATGVDAGQPCCPVVLVVEAVGPIAQDPMNGPEIVNGCEPCDFSVVNQYKVTVKRCTSVFDNSRTDGAPANATARSQFATDLVAEEWLLFQALRCCILEAGCCPRGNVVEAATSLIEGCGKFWTTIEWEHTPCC